MLTVPPELLSPATPTGDLPRVRLWKKKTFSLNRGVIEIRCSSDNVLDISSEVYRIVKNEFNRGFLNTFAFGTVLRFESKSPDITVMEPLVDVIARSKGTWQWLIVTDEFNRKAYGVHTWMSGYLTPVYFQFAEQLEAENYQLNFLIKKQPNFFKLKQPWWD